MKTIFWFRQDLRLSDHPGLMEASQLGEMLPIYIHTDTAVEPFKRGRASRVYLYHALKSLDDSLQHHLNFYKGTPQSIFRDLIERLDIRHVYWTRCYEPWQVGEDDVIETMLTTCNVHVHICEGSYLWDPNTIKNEEGSYYKVFSAYKRKVYRVQPRDVIPKPTKLCLIKDEQRACTLNELGLLSHHPWEEKIIKYWRSGEDHALQKLDDFVKHRLLGYQKGRDEPGRDHTSKLSMNLHFGEISPHQIWHAVRSIPFCVALSEDRDHFLSELIWREFSCYLMTHVNTLPTKNFQSKFNAFPWRADQSLFEAWKKGQTGYPLVDAGMRELWETGYMHNRVRMVVASFLVKNLMIHWHWGRDWFWDCLVDADLANNSASWQWVAGCGADAAPYFRIFNPVTQGEKFDPEGVYTRKFLPELRLLPSKYLFKPWTAPRDVLNRSNIILGEHYPYPIVDLSVSRHRALQAYQLL